MKNTLALSKDFPNAANKCSPYTKAEGKLVKIPFCQIDNLAPAGSISSSVNDLSHWVMMQLDNGKYKDQLGCPCICHRTNPAPAFNFGKWRSAFQ